MPFGLTSAAVSSSIPMPSSAGDCATSARSRPNRLRCSKCWSMSTPGQQSEPGAHLRHPLLRRCAARPERDHVARDGGSARAGAGDHRAVLMALDELLAEQRAADDARQAQLVAAGHEDRGRVVELRDEARVVRVVAHQRPHAAHVADAHLSEERQVELGRLVAQRRGRRDDDDAGIAAAGQRDEARQDLALPELVLGTADHEQVTGPSLPGAGLRRHAEQHSELQNGSNVG